MSDCTVRDPKVRQAMGRAWLIQDRELREAVAAQTARHAALLARSAEARRTAGQPRGLNRWVLDCLRRLFSGRGFPKTALRKADSQTRA